MRRMFALLIGLAFSAAMAFGQGTSTGQSSPSAAPTNAQGSASRTPSTPNQSLPGNANPANASSEGGANAQAVTPEKSKSAPPGTAAGNTSPTDREGARPPNTDALEELAKPGLFSTMPWLWAGMGVVGALILIGILMRRDRSRDTSERRNTTLVTVGDQDAQRRDEDIRRVG